MRIEKGKRMIGRGEVGVGVRIRVGVRVWGKVRV